MESLMKRLEELNKENRQLISELDESVKKNEYLRKQN